jgi:predicted permease
MPDWTRDIARELAAVRLRPEREREIIDELAAHLEDRYCEVLGRGSSEAEARAAALAELNDVLVPELRRVESRWPDRAPVGNPRRAAVLQTLAQDVRYALRNLRLSPGFTAVSILTLAIGIGACTLMLSAVNAVLLRPLPYPAADRLTVFWGTAPEKGLPEVDFTQGMAAVYRDRTRTLEGLAAYGTTGFNITGAGDAERITGAAVSADFFRVLGVPPIIGRVPVAGEANRDARTNVVVLSHALWMRRYGGDSSLVGRTIDLNGTPATVLGVMPPDFGYPGRTEAWAPLELDPTAFNCWCYSMIGRMRHDVTPDEVRREIATITDDFSMTRRDIFPTAKPGGARIIAMSLSKRLVGNVERQLLILLAAVACVLLIACANIANLLLARTAARSREIAVRCCLGASPSRIAAQLLTESLLLSLGGALVGALAAIWGASRLRRLPTTQFPRIDQAHVDLVVLTATATIALVTGLLCGLVPAWRATRVDLQNAVKNGVKGSGTRTSRRTSDAFVVAQFALSLLLLVAAGLLVRSYHSLANVDTGYRVDDVLVARMQVPYPRYDSAHVVRSLYDRLLTNVRAMPGVRSVGLASRVPLTPGNPQDNIVAEGKEAKNPNEPVRVANIRMVTPDYFAAIGTPLRRGRLFRASDDDRATRVAVVDELFAAHFWPGEDPIGRRFRHGGDTSSGRWLTVIGVVANVKHQRLDEAGDLQVYEHFAQQTTWVNYLVVRTTTERRALVAELRTALKSIDPAIPLFEVQTMRDAVDLSLGTRRLTNVLLTGFSLTALILAAIGIYGVISLGVNGRVREFGIRMALGARPIAVRALVLRHATWTVAVGVAVGLAGAVATTRYLRALLFGVGPLDWRTLAGAAVLLGATALVASYFPAHRATRADPMLALRSE